jgi:hypothetical protein
MKKLLLLILLLNFMVSCESKKEQELNEREKKIILREKQISLKEAEYNSLIRLRDSVFAVRDSVKNDSDSITKWPEKLRRSWNSKMLCQESGCSQYVIGDQRNEIWQFLSDSTGMYTHVINNNKLVRIFAAKYIGNKIFLEFASDSTSKNKTKMNVVLNDIKENVIKGTQTITGKDNCTAKFSVELTLTQKK